jgi:hypothetical protein
MRARPNLGVHLGGNVRLEDSRGSSKARTQRQRHTKDMAIPQCEVTGYTTSREYDRLKRG